MQNLDSCCNGSAALQDAMAVDAFSSCQQAYAAEELFDAYRKADAEAVKACVARNSVFADLDTQVSSCWIPPACRSLYCCARHPSVSRQWDVTLSR